ncbi:peptidyl-tRNA hydrolase [Daldinia caldariorum]|uniref:peptidyl-tRNA hydrolase n=1 Tax=Daldinia caldariorum TaxID=326644 RepID=UPI0020079D5A|nr:peptidyl-tRNA hydrolase [Daldinia caldariorum]KAI1463381.1 peptidyl-tRNA hydrolase [Daldinia caldariorum]
MFNPHFLLISLGNQAPYYECLHSTGHFALAALQKFLSSSQPPFKSERYGGKSCLASTDPGYLTMVQSPTQMNVSGPWVAKTWKEMLQTHQLEPSQLSLVLVHDDLESQFGHVKVRPWYSSHRGHNGVKSVNASIKPPSSPGTWWSRISIGIGRPEARDHTSVADYVLKNLTRYQKDIIDTEVGSNVFHCLQGIEEIWGQEFQKAYASRYALSHPVWLPKSLRYMSKDLERVEALRDSTIRHHQRRKK